MKICDLKKKKKKMKKIGYEIKYSILMIKKKYINKKKIIYILNIYINRST